MGIVRSVVRCASCSYESVTYKPLQAFQLTVEPTLDGSLQ